MITIRIFFSKKAEAAYISHLDLQRAMARALRRSGLPVWYTQGFNPHIYMTFALPLPLMQESETETVDCKLEDAPAGQEMDYAAFLPPLNAALPRGITATGIAPAVHPASAISAAEYIVHYPTIPAETLQTAVRQYNQAQKAVVMRKTKRTEASVDLKEVLPRLELMDDGNAFCMRLPAGAALTYNPDLVLGYLQQEGLPRQEAQVLRTKVLMDGGGAFC